MDFELYFCADGILRAKLGNEKPMIPVKFLQDNSPGKGNDFRFWARWWESTTYFESGLTVGKFLSCLEPWGEFWSDFTGKDVIAYIKESRQLTVVNDNTNNENSLDWISISYNTDASPVSEYLDKNVDRMLDNINEWLNKPKNTRLTGKWDIQSSYKISGFIKDKAEQYSINYSPINKLANLPIVLSDEHILYFSNWKLEQILGKGKDHFFQDNAFGLCSLNEGYTKFIIGKKYHKIRDIVEGFFLQFQSNPTTRNEFVENILEIKNEVIELNFNKNKASNVVPLFSASNELIDLDKQESLKIKKINFSINGLSPIIMSMERNRLYWEEMLEKTYKEKNVILKIGQIEKAKAPEKRVFNYIIKDDNDPANPKPSEDKIW